MLTAIDLFWRLVDHMWFTRSNPASGQIELPFPDGWHRYTVEMYVPWFAYQLIASKPRPMVAITALSRLIAGQNGVLADRGGNIVDHIWGKPCSYTHCTTPSTNGHKTIYCRVIASSHAEEEKMTTWRKKRKIGGIRYEARCRGRSSADSSDFWAYETSRR